MNFIAPQPPKSQFPHYHFAILLAVAVSSIFFTIWATAGTLNPSSAPGATMRTLQEIYDSITGTSFDSSSITANQDGSVIEGLKHINENLGWASSSNNIYNLNTGGNVGIGTTSPGSLLAVHGGNITHVANTNPAQVGARTSSTGAFTRFAIADNVAYVAQGGASGDIEIINISNPASPSLMTTLVTPGAADGVYVVGKLLYVADGTTFRIYDITNKTSPVLVGSSTMSGALDVTVSGKYAYVSDYTAGVAKVVDVSNPASPSLVFSSNFLSASPYEISVSGNYMFAARNNWGFQIWDVSNPRIPVILAGIDPGNTRTVHAIGKHLYVGGTTGLNIYDISNPASPALLATDASVNVYRLVSSGKYLYATLYPTGGGSALYVYDVTNPSAPVNVGTYSTSGSLVAIEVVGRYAYVTEFGGVFRIIDLNGTYTPTLSTGSLGTGHLSVLDDTVIGGNLSVRTGITVGSQGMLVNGEGSFSALSSSSVLSIIQRGRGSVFDLKHGTTSVLTANASGNIGIGSSSPFATLTVKGSSSFSPFAIASSSGASLFRVAKGGNVGIGTVAPAQKLDIYSSSSGSVIGTLRNDNPAGNAFWRVQNDTGKFGSFAVYGNTFAAIASLQNNAAVSAEHSLYMVSNASVSSGGSGSIFFLTGGYDPSTQSRMTIRSNGNVGIGTTNPMVKLDVSGTSGSTIFRVSSGSAGRFSVQDAGLTTITNTTTSTGVGSIFRVMVNAMSQFAAMSAILTDDAAAPDEYFLAMQSDIDGTPDSEFLFTTNGNALADGSFTGGGADVAEWIPTQDTTLEAGDLVVTDGTSSKSYVKKSLGVSNDPSVIGIISTDPGLVAGGGDTDAHYDISKTHALVALAGRVPLKFSAENGHVQPGDHLTSSSIPGVAMRATKPGMTVGIALEASDLSESTVMTFVRVGFWMPSGSEQVSDVLPSDLQGKSIVSAVLEYLEKGIITIKKIITDDIETKRIKSEAVELVGDDGSTYCVRIIGGNLQSVKGECSTQP